MSEVQFDIVVVGAGPAGMAAACTAAGSGRRVALIDETPWLGGQIWRGQQAHPTNSTARTWLARFKTSGAMLLDRTCAMAAPEPRLLLAERDGQPLRILWERLIVATGARELFLPFPGWTLPGVIGPGGLLSLVKNGWPVAGKRVVLAGSGPLLLAAAEGLAKAGAIVVSICEQAPRKSILSFGLGLWRHPGKLWQAASLRSRLRQVPYRCGAWPVVAEGSDNVRSVTLTDGQGTWTEECDLLGCAFGLVPNVELGLALGCELDDGFIKVDLMQSTSVPNVYCAGEPTGITGADAALVEGQIAGYAASGQTSKAELLFAKRRSWHRFRGDLASTFALRPELKALAKKETVVCRCEDVTFGELQPFRSWREAKLQARCGMGPCQGRVCGPATKILFGWGMESARPPVSPVRVRSLISKD